MALYLRLSRVGVLSKQLNVSNWFLVWELPSGRPKVQDMKLWHNQKNAVGKCKKGKSSTFRHENVAQCCGVENVGNCVMESQKYHKITLL